MKRYFKKNRFTPIMVSQSDSVVLGQLYKADIILSVTKPELGFRVRVNGQELPTEGGIAKYYVLSDSIGFFQVDGTVHTMVDSKLKVFDISKKYKVTLPKVSISHNYPDILFVGIQNRIRIEVEGFDYHSVSVMMDKGTLRYFNPLQNEYIAEFGSSGKARLFVDVNLKNGRKIRVATKEFTITHVPKPEAIFGKVPSGYASVMDLLQQDSIAVMEFISGLHMIYNVVSYSFRFIPTNGISESNFEKSPVISRRLKELIQNGQSGDVIIIENISAQSQFGAAKLRPILYIIN